MTAGNLLVGEGQEDVFLCARSASHVLLLAVKHVATGLSAADQFGQRVVLRVKDNKIDQKHIVDCFCMRNTDSKWWLQELSPCQK